MKVLDLKKQYKGLYQPSAKKPVLVDVPNLQFAMIDGAIEKGSEPGKSPAFAEATQALYSLSYTLKFMLKKTQDGRDRLSRHGPRRALGSGRWHV